MLKIPKQVECVFMLPASIAWRQIQIRAHVSGRGIRRLHPRRSKHPVSAGAWSGRAGQVDAAARAASSPTATATAKEEEDQIPTTLCGFNSICHTSWQTSCGLTWRSYACHLNVVYWEQWLKMSDIFWQPLKALLHISSFDAPWFFSFAKRV